MKHNLLIQVLFFFIPSLLCAQNIQTKKVEQKNKSENTKEIYYVLKSDQVTKHGEYKKYKYNSLEESGFYKNGIKDSVWTKYNVDKVVETVLYKNGLMNGVWIQYNWNGELLKTKGNYSNDEKTGIWEYYDNEGKLDQKYDYTLKKVLYDSHSEKYVSDTCKVVKGTDTVKIVLDQPPIFIGGSTIMFRYIIKNINYPAMAKEKGVAGKVFIQFTIDTDGKAKDHKIIKGIGSGCDEEALRCVKMIPDEWCPGMLNGEPVKVIYVIPINFKIG